MNPPSEIAKVRATLLGGLCLLYAACAGLLGLAAGCVAAPIAPGADPIVVNAERAIQAAELDVKAFLNFDAENVALVRAAAPDAHAFAEALRARLKNPATDPIVVAQAALETYKASRTAAAGTTLEERAAAVENLARQLRLYLLQLNPPPK